MISFGWSELMSFFIILIVACNFFVFVLKCEKKQKKKISQTYEFKILGKQKLFVDIKSRLVYEIEYDNRYIFISLYKNKHGDFVTYYKNRLVPIKISSKQANEIVKFMYIDNSNYLYNLETLIVYELNVLNRILIVSPYITEDGNKCQYQNGTMLELCD